MNEPFKKLMMLIMLSVLVSLRLVAQDIEVHGIVTDQAGETVIGATVMQKGTSNGTVTDIDGNFTLTVPHDATLTISYIGFATRDKAVSGPRQTTELMQEESQRLGELG